MNDLWVLLSDKEGESCVSYEMFSRCILVNFFSLLWEININMRKWHAAKGHGFDLKPWLPQVAQSTCHACINHELLLCVGVCNVDTMADRYIWFDLIWTDKPNTCSVTLLKYTIIWKYAFPLPWPDLPKIARRWVMLLLTVLPLQCQLLTSGLYCLVYFNWRVTNSFSQKQKESNRRGCTVPCVLTVLQFNRNTEHDYN